MAEKPKEPSKQQLPPQPPRGTEEIPQAQAPAPGRILQLLRQLWETPEGVHPLWDKEPLPSELIALADRMRYEVEISLGLTPMAELQDQLKAARSAAVRDPLLADALQVLEGQVRQQALRVNELVANDLQLFVRAYTQGGGYTGGPIIANVLLRDVETPAEARAHQAQERQSQASQQFYRMAAQAGVLTGDTTEEELQSLVGLFKETYRAAQAQVDQPQPRSFEDLAREALVAGIEMRVPEGLDARERRLALAARLPQSLEEQQQRQVARQQRQLAFETGIPVPQREATQFAIPEEQAGGPTAEEPIGGGPARPTPPPLPGVETPAEQVIREQQQERAAVLQAPVLSPEESLREAETQATAAGVTDVLGQVPTEQRAPFADWLQSALPGLRAQQEQEMFRAGRVTGAPAEFGEFLRQRVPELYRGFTTEQERKAKRQRQEEDRSLLQAARPSVIFRS